MHFLPTWNRHRPDQNIRCGGRFGTYIALPYYYSYLASWFQAELEIVSTQLEDAEHKVSTFGKQCTNLESQLTDAHELMQEETRQKLSLQSKLRQADEKVDSLHDALEEEEELKKAVEQKMLQMTVSLSDGV